MRILAVAVAVALLGVTAPAGRAEEGGWVSLFDGQSLKGWAQKNGTASYRVEDGTLVGKTAEGSPNSFLCTGQEYGDFELEFEVKVHDSLNSGVQIRSKQKTAGAAGADAKAPEGRVYGPQVEIAAADPKGSVSGYVYGESTGRGWITPKERVVPHAHFKNGEWNAYRVAAKGPRIQVWINGQAIDDLTDEPIHQTHPKGFIGLQVHGIKKGTGPYEVAWRNIRIRELK